MDGSTEYAQRRSIDLVRPGDYVQTRALPGMDTNGGEGTEWTRVVANIHHRGAFNFTTLATRAGRRVTVTSDHQVVTRVNGTLVMLSAADVLPGDVMLATTTGSPGAQSTEVIKIDDVVTSVTRHTLPEKWELVTAHGTVLAADSEVFRGARQHGNASHGLTAPAGAGSILVTTMCGDVDTYAGPELELAGTQSSVPNTTASDGTRALLPRLAAWRRLHAPLAASGLGEPPALPS